MAKNPKLDPGYPLPFFSPCNLDFDFLYHYYFDFITRDVFSIFEFKGVPDTINETFLKYCIFLGGKATFFELDSGELVALNGTYSDRPDLYYVPEKMLVANPRLEKTYLMKRDEECIVVYCSETDIYTTSDRFGGLYSLIAKTATMLADNDLSINVAQKNTRLINILSAEDHNTKESIEVVIGKQYRGEPAAVVMKTLIDNVQSVPLTANTKTQTLIQLVELHQYILSHFYEAIGLSTHDNMKKERLINAEISDNDSLSKLNICNMMKTIQLGLDRVNAKYNKNLEITLNPVLEPEKEELEDDSSLTPEVSEQTTDAKEPDAKEPEEETQVEETEELSESETQEPEQHEVETKEQEDNPHHKPHENIEINISLEDEASADISIETGGEALGDNARVPEMVDDSGDDTGNST